MQLGDPKSTFLLNDAASTPTVHRIVSSTSTTGKSENQHPITRRIIIPNRPMSTTTATAVPSKPASAAPFPTLPTKVEIQTLISNIERELQEARNELSELQHERNPSRTVQPVISNPERGIFHFHNLIFQKNNIESIIADNTEQSEKAESQVLIPQKRLFSRIDELPFYHDCIETQEEIAVPMLAIQVEEEMILKEKHQQLAHHYAQLHQQWNKYSERIDDYHTRVETSREEWPTEIPISGTKRTQEEIDTHLADDIEMVLHPERRFWTYFNTNMEIQDPVKEHDCYRHRIIWTDEEISKFLTKYTEHPKKFAMIASYIGTKTIKEVIEFYYINKFILNLKERENAHRKRGGSKKKVISEGAAKKSV